MTDQLRFHETDAKLYHLRGTEATLGRWLDFQKLILLSWLLVAELVCVERIRQTTSWPQEVGQSRRHQVICSEGGTICVG